MGIKQNYKDILFQIHHIRLLKEVWKGIKIMKREYITTDLDSDELIACIDFSNFIHHDITMY